MSLSNATVKKLADALAPEVIEYIFNDDRWTEFLIEMISDAVVEKMGQLEGDLHGELSYCISERILLSKV